MAINDVSLTAGMRSNLLSLQSTVDLLNRTQSRLSSGKKVNSAIDNPTSFFASQALTSRASVIDSLKDGMGQAVQTITAADKGIKAITAMIEQAKGIAQSALSATQGSGYDTEEVTLNTVVAGDTIQVGTAVFTAGPSGVATTTSLASQTITVSTAIDIDDTVKVGGITFTAKSASTTSVSALSIDMNANALVGGVSTVTVGGVAYTAVASTSATSYDSYTLHLEDMQAGNTVEVSGATYTAVASVATTAYNHFTVDLTAVALNDTITIGGSTYTASNGTSATEFDITAGDLGAAELKLKIAAQADGDEFATSGNTVNAFDITAADGNVLGAADVSQTGGHIGVAADTTVTTNTVGVAEFKIVDGDDTGNTLRLKNAIDARQPGLFNITRGGVANRDVSFAFTGDATTLAADTVDLGVTAGSLSAVGATTTTQVDTTVTSANQFVMSGNAAMDAANLTAKINALQGANYTASVVGAVISLVPDGSDLETNSVTSTDGGIAISSTVTTSAATLGQFEFGIGADENATAASLASKIGTFFGAQLGVANASSCNVIEITSGTTDLTATTVQAGSAAANEITIASVTSTSTADAYDAGYFAVTGNNATDAATIANLINSTAATTNAGFSATASSGVITIERESADIAAGNVLVTGGTMTEEMISGAASTELTALQGQYTEMLNQIDTVAADSGYKGKNLLAGDTLVVKFEGDHKLDVAGFDATAFGLGVIQNETWTAGGSIDADVVKLDNAMNTLRQQASQMSGNLSIITVRQDFSTNMINTLTEGSDKLTLADANEEGANMLMLQTRQSLSTSALSMSAQAAQSVLRLFQ